jgi:hypothetical protein
MRVKRLLIGVSCVAVLTATAIVHTGESSVTLPKTSIP